MLSLIGRRRRLSLLLALAFVAAACGSPVGRVASSAVASASPSPAPLASASSETNPSDQAVYAAIERQVEAIRELKATATVTPVLLDAQGVSDWLSKANAAQTDHVALANESRLFADLGLIPAGSSLEKLELDLEVGQVAGFYDPVSKGLYVVSQTGGVGPVEKLTFSHEYTHALQDQNFGLDKLATDATDQGDRDLARTSLPEGDATLTMTFWSEENLSIADLLQIANESMSGPQAEQLAKAPEILRQTLTFPYEQGLAFVQGIYAKGGWAAVDKVYASPPDSTAQIIHPELYTTGVKPVPVTLSPVSASLGSGWKLTMQDTLGEFQLGIWLEGQNPTSQATTAGESATDAWAGDRVGLYEGPNGSWAVVLKTAWRSAAGAQAFDTAAGPTLKGLPNPSRICAGGSDVTVVVASDQSFIPELGACG